MKNKLKKIALLVFLLGSSMLWAQPQPPRSPTPLGGVALIAIAGAALGSKAYNLNKKQD